MRSRRAIVWVTVFPLVLVLIGGIIHLRPKRTLVVWSCGGNYELLKDYATQFEAREGVRVRYTAAPVAFLLARALRCSSPPDVMVGRGGPGWDALVDVGRASGLPTVFGADPLVLAVPAGNPARIQSIEDLGHSDVRVAMSPGAMRPKAKIPGMFMRAVSDKLHPGLVERWENQAVVRAKCGRHLLDPLLDGRADVAVAPRSLLTYRPYAGKIEEIPIPSRVLRTMPRAPAIPQCAVALDGPDAEQTALAQRFVAGLPKATETLEAHGYLTTDDPRYKQLGHLLEIFTPKDMPGWQTRLAEALDKADIAIEARRRFLHVIYTFGPNRYMERALCRAADHSQRNGQTAAARRDWQRVLSDFPPGEPVEYDLPTSPRRLKARPIQAKPHEYWRQEATARLRDLPADAPDTSPILRDPVVRGLFPIRVTHGDPPKNGTRSLGLGLHLLVAGDFQSATRDLLKIPTLHYPSRHMANAEYLLGLCAEARNLPAVARDQWQRVVRDYPDTKIAQAAQQALGRLPDTPTAPSRFPMPDWEESFATNAQRGMTYGMRLRAHRLPVYTIKEMLKIECAVYGKHSLGTQARCRAAIACRELDLEAAAIHQWRAALRHTTEGPWAEVAREGLRDLGEPPTALPGPIPAPPKGGFAKRFRLAREFHQAKIHNDDQIALEYLKVLTVARPPNPKLTTKTRRMIQQAETELAEALQATGRSQTQIDDVIAYLPRLPSVEKKP